MMKKVAFKNDDAKCYLILFLRLMFMKDFFKGQHKFFLTES